MTELKITQADRDAAAAYWKASRIGSGETVRRYKAGEADNAFIVQAFAHHRIAAEEGKAELVEALGKIMPIRVSNGPDYAEVVFSDGTKHATQAMTMHPQDWLDIAAALARVRGEG